VSVTDAVQIALVARMRADATLTGLIGTRVFDDVPPDDTALFPYVSFGPEDWTDPLAECLEGEDGVVQLDVWSRQAGRDECKRIVDRIAVLFRDTDLALPAPYRCPSVVLLQRRIFRDPDGVTTHGVVQLRIQTEEVG
jgi:hypothetical protein